MFHRRKWPGVAAGLALAVAGPLVLTACGGAQGSSSTLTLGVITPATTFEAPDMNWGNESTYNQAVYDSLLQSSPTGVIEPHLATAWSYNADKTVLTMTLRTGVKFTDGTPFDASVAAQNLEAFQKGTSNNAGYLINMASATAESPTKLVIKLKQPDPAFLTYLGQAAGSQESPKAWKSQTASTVPVGSGPYVLDTKATVVGSSYVFTANPNYWDKAEQHYSKVVMNVYTTQTTTLDAIEGGQVNAANTFDDTTIPQIQNAGFTVYPLQLNWAGLSLLDRTGKMSGPLGKVQVRQAINMAFNRAALLKDMSNGYGSVTTEVFPTNSPGYDKSLESYYPFNPAKAKQLLAEAGYPHGFTLAMPTITAAFGSATYALIEAELANIGIKVDYTDYQGSTIFTAILAPKYPATYFTLEEDPVPWQMAQFLLTKNATFNPFHSTNATVAGYLSTMQTGSSAQAATAAKALNRYMVENAWFAPFFRPQSSFVADSHTNVTVQAGNAVPYLWNITPKES
jgi:peptide/nickel transport system substrate-binding protein